MDRSGARASLLLAAVLAAGCPAPGAGGDPGPGASASAGPTATPPAGRTTPRPSPSLPPVPTAPPPALVGAVTTVIGPADPLAPQAGDVDGPAAAARMGAPWGLACDPAAKPPVVYVADAGNHTIRRVSQLPGGGWTVATLAAPDGARIKVVGPRGLALDATASPPVLYVGEGDRQRIRALTLGPAGVTDRVIAGPADATGPVAGAFADGPGAAARFNGGLSLALDAPRRRLLVADHDNHRLRAIALDDPAHPVATLVGDGVAVAREGPIAQARVYKPAGLAVRDGKLVVSDDFCRLRTIDLAAPAPRLRLLAGGGQGNRDGFWTDVLFHDPWGLAFDGQGRLIVGDTANHRIRRATPQGDVALLAGSGPATTVGQTLVAGALVDGPADQARFFAPFGITVDAEGAIWIADQRNCALRRLVPRD